MPISGDAITVVAGILREPIVVFTVLVFVAKAGRYTVLALLTVHVIG
jgi:membrane protein YqaA with SNARE-associated domain